MFRGFWGLKMVPQVPTVIDGYKKIVEKLIHESDHFAPTPIINITQSVPADLQDCKRETERKKERVRERKKEKKRERDLVC